MADYFTDELRARSDEAIAALFQVRPDLLSPVPTDLSALSARANSTPSLMRALESLNKFQLEVLTATCILNEPFSKAELLSITTADAGDELLRLWAAALVYKDGSKFRLNNQIRPIPNMMRIVLKITLRQTKKKTTKMGILKFIL